MNVFKKIIGLVVSIPARIKGVKFGKDSYIGPGYDLEPKMDGLEIGNDVLIGRNAWIDLSIHDKDAKIVIGDGTNIGRNITMSSKKVIRIGKNVYYPITFH
jgi:acetyltransferase-like isoleucine patch superfamily enzyme